MRRRRLEPEVRDGELVQEPEAFGEPEIDPFSRLAYAQDSRLARHSSNRYQMEALTQSPDVADPALSALHVLPLHALQPNDLLLERVPKAREGLLVLELLVVGHPVPVCREDPALGHVARHADLEGEVEHVGRQARVEDLGFGFGVLLAPFFGLRER